MVAGRRLRRRIRVDRGIAKPAYQTDTGCRGRSYADLSADADPDTGLVVYDRRQLVGGRRDQPRHPADRRVLRDHGRRQLEPQWAYANSGAAQRHRERLQRHLRRRYPPISATPAPVTTAPPASARSPATRSPAHPASAVRRSPPARATTPTPRARAATAPRSRAGSTQRPRHQLVDPVLAGQRRQRAADPGRRHRVQHDPSQRDRLSVARSTSGPSTTTAWWPRTAPAPTYGYTYSFTTAAASATTLSPRSRSRRRLPSLARRSASTRPARPTPGRRSPTTAGTSATAPRRTRGARHHGPRIRDLG